MGRSGIAMTFVTGQELPELKTLLEKNRIEPVWHGNIPDLGTIPKWFGNRNRKKFLRRKFRPTPSFSPSIDL
jgi:hypothetical protein